MAQASETLRGGRRLLWAERPRCALSSRSAAGRSARGGPQCQRRSHPARASGASGRRRARAPALCQVRAAACELAGDAAGWGARSEPPSWVLEGAATDGEFIFHFKGDWMGEGSDRLEFPRVPPHFLVLCSFLLAPY